MRWLVLLAALGSGCALRPLPPHVSMPVERLEAVDVIWWSNESLCQLRVINWKDPKMPGSFTVDVDSSLCFEMLKGRNYKLP